VAERGRFRRAPLFLALLVAAGCAGADAASPPPIERGTPCARCGMAVEQPGFAAVRRVERKWRTYDAIECLVADRGRTAGGAAWLTDYDTRALLPEADAWVVHGSFPSPMGGGLVAFADRAEAESLAAATAGTVGRLADVRDPERAP
jgi:nitrous oxide reductase accessory protein NosL